MPERSSYLVSGKTMRADRFKRELTGRARIVVDANLAADAILGEPARRSLALSFFAACRAAGVQLLAPPIFAAEADSVVRRALHMGLLSSADAVATYDALDSLPVEFATDLAQLMVIRVRARAIADLLQQPRVYDATYAALAEVRGCEFWTADKSFANAAKQVRRQLDGTTSPALAVVRFVGDY
jgi:predicted nucleic acid-binding protein